MAFPILSQFLAVPFLVGNPSDIDPLADAAIFTPSPPVLRSAYSPPLKDMQAGQQVMISTTITNNDAAQDWPSLVIIEVTDASGITTQISWQSGIVEADGQMNVGVSWMPEDAGTYELRTFVVSDLENLNILAKVSSSLVTVARS